MTKLVSVIIPTYNRAAFIAESIQSVLDQEYGDYTPEVIVIDDGSTDDTEKIVQSFGHQIRYKKIRHGGNPAVVRNEGIRLASGNIVAFQDSDDTWPKNKMSTQLAYFNDPEIMLTYGQAAVIDERGKKTGELVVPEEFVRYGERFESLIKTNVISTLTVMVRKVALDAVGGFDERESLKGVEDYELWLRMAARYPKGSKYIDTVLANYRRHGGNISSVPQLDSLQKIHAALVTAWTLRLSSRSRLALEEQIHRIQENISRVKTAENTIPHVSVVMSVYNGERFLKQAIDSVLSQTMKNFEFIILDDGSTDTTLDIILHYDDPRIRCIPQQNHGLVYTLNKGVELATALFVARMDADDISLPNRLRNEYEWISRSSKRGLVSTFFELIDFETSQPIKNYAAYPPDNEELRRCLYYVNPFAHGAALFRKAAFVEVGMYRPTYWPAEDYDLWRRILTKYESTLIPEILFQYRINNPASISQKNNTKQSKMVAKIHDEIWAEQFIRKNSFHIVRSYLRLPSSIPAESTDLLPALKNLYLEQQFTLAKFSLLRGYVFRALEIMLGLIIIKPKFSLLLLEYVPKGIKKSYNRLK